MSAKDIFWQTKLHARLHDPAEKALVLLRDPEGHEGGTSKVLHRDLGFDQLPVGEWLDPDNADVLDGVLFEKGIPITMYKHVKRADWWAAAADRPQWPMEEAISNMGKTYRTAPGTRVSWTQSPILIHPLTGERLDLKSLAETDLSDIKKRSHEHLSSLIIRDGTTGESDWRKTLLAFWRFGPELAREEDEGKLGFLWPLLPADTRVPDHSIWDHLDLTSAFAGAFAADGKGEAALLTLSIGPVQPFIAAARSTSDLWAGSHLLARLSWEAMKVVCERLGPDAILFPRLRGIPQVDVWLRDEMGLPRERFESCESCKWAKIKTDANPLFAAALPNRFVAVVPADQVEDLAKAIEENVRTWLRDIGKATVNRLLREAGLEDGEEKYCHRQMVEQLDGFPEVHWAAVPFSLIKTRNEDRQTDLDVSRLKEAMAPFFGVDAEAAFGFFDKPAWKVLAEEWDDNITFWAPNPGVLYPAVYDLAARALAATKVTRPFRQLEQGGWRDSLTGENEWLTLNKQDLDISQGQRKDTLWQKIHEKKPSWAREGEYLGGLSAVKRLWPTLFSKEVADATGAGHIGRFVVSTHTMALASQIEKWLAGNGEINDKTEELLSEYRPEPVALPGKIMASPSKRGAPSIDQAKQLPGLLDKADEVEDEKKAGEIRKAVAGTLGRQNKLEAYYAMLLLDGDHMGRILSGDMRATTIEYRDSFHPQVKEWVERKARENGRIAEYADLLRALSPNRHLAISAALNDFALYVVPHIVEHEHLGRLIYAGGDDVHAMLPVKDLLPAMQRLRCAWSGNDPEDEKRVWEDVRQARKKKLICKNGFAALGGRLFRMMGGATVSCGAVIAHHQAPLAAVRRELQDAERRAKNEGGRDAFSITIVKRAGGALRLTAKWGEPLMLLRDLSEFLARPSVSRRAAYNCLLWLKDLPRDATDDMLGSLLDYQFQRQAGAPTDKAFWRKKSLASRLAQLARKARKEGYNWLDYLENFLSVAEFLAREVRSEQAQAEQEETVECTA